MRIAFLFLNRRRIKTTEQYAFGTILSSDIVIRFESIFISYLHLGTYNFLVVDTVQPVGSGRGGCFTASDGDGG